MKFTIKILLFSFLFFSCSKKIENIKFKSEFSVDKNLHSNKIFKNMDDENEIQMRIDSEPPKTKKTTNIIFNDNDEYVCEPIFWKNKDTLNINIVYHSGFSSGGFNIRVYKNTFDIIPTSGSTDVITDNNKPSDFKKTKQKLTLDKSNYKPNDSIYGFVDFEKIEYDQYGNVIPHRGKGYFRGIIEYYE